MPRVVSMTTKIRKFVRGMGSVVDISPSRNRHPRYARRVPNKSTVAPYWNAVGEYLWSAASESRVERKKEPAKRP